MKNIKHSSNHRNHRIFIITAIILFCVSVSFLCIYIAFFLKPHSTPAENAHKSTQSNNTPSASDIVKNIKVGWNLGNTLDSYSKDTSAYDNRAENRGSYQMMATYSTKPYSSWDASSCPYFSTDNSDCTLNWNITSLNSSKTQACGNFSFQIINNTVPDTGTSTLDFAVTNAQFKTASGTVITLSDLINTYSKPIKNKVTAYITADLSKIPELKTSSDIIGGTLTISVKINKYPLTQTANITKETYYETLSGNPVTTKAMIDKVKDAGFNAVRLPVTYSNHMDSTGNIDKAWLKRVSTVVNYVLDNNMYCIIDIHNDAGPNGWLKADQTSFNKNSTKFKKIWTQIAEYFKADNNKLLFEGYNEILNTRNDWSTADASSYSIANKFNQIFVDTVRNTGGNNSTRCLVVNTYAANSEADPINNFTLPKDSVSNRLIVGVHYYGVSQASIDSVLNRVKSKFTDKGVPFIFGEFASSKKIDESTRISSANYLITNAKKYNIPCFWWDDGNKGDAQCDYSLLNRVSLNWYSSKLVQAIIDAAH